MKHRFFSSTFFRIALISFVTIVAAVAITVGVALNIFSQALDEKQRVIEGQAAAKLQKYVLGQYTRISDMLNYTSTRTGVAARLAAIAQQPDRAYRYADIQALLSFAEMVLSSDADIEDCILIAQNGAVYSQTATQYGDAVASYDFLNDPLFRAFLASDSGFRFAHDNPVRYKIASRGEVITILWSIYNPARLPRRERVGLLIVNVPIDRYEAAYGDFSGVMLGDLEIYDTRGEKIYSSGNNAPDTPMDEPILYPVGATGLTVRSLLPSNMIREQTNALIQRSVFFVLLAVGLSFVVIFVAVYSYNRRSQRLIDHMREVQKGRLDRRIAVRKRDEIGVLGEALNDMTEKLDTYIRRTYQAELAARDSEIALLQSQINPHFLFNSLENLSMLAARAHNDALADLAADIGRLFRISIRSRDRIVRIEDELEYIRLYINIHVARFGPRLQFGVQADEALLARAIPKLIVQPLVENAVIHGHRVLKPGARVDVSIEAAGDGRIRVSVSDNGAGMTRERICEALSGSASIGLPNVAQRIRLMFGDECALLIESAVGEGTRVSFCLPAMTVEEMNAHVQAADR